MRAASPSNFRLRAGYAAFAFVCAYAVVARAQDSGPMVDLRSLMNGGSSLTAPLSVRERSRAQSDGFAAPTNAMLEAGRRNYGEYLRFTKDEADANTRVARARRKMLDLATERERALDEMRRGLFCAACGHTRSEIEAVGENWQEHLNRNSGGRPVGATPEQLANKVREFEQKAVSIMGETARAQADAESAAQSKTAAARNVINTLFSWKDALRSEDEARAKAWDATVAGYRTQWASYQDLIRSLDGAIARAKRSELQGDSVDGLIAQREDVAGRMRILSNEVEQDYFQHDQQALAFQERLSSGRTEFENLIQSVGGPPLALIHSFTTLPTVPAQGPQAIELPGTSLSFTPRGSGFDLNYGVANGLFRASLRTSENWLRSEFHLDLVFGMETPAGPLEVGMRRTTNPDGSMTDTPIVNKPDLIDPITLMNGAAPPPGQ